MRLLDSLSITDCNKFHFNYSRRGKQLGSLRGGADTNGVNQKWESYIACYQLGKEVKSRYICRYLFLYKPDKFSFTSHLWHKSSASLTSIYLDAFERAISQEILMTVPNCKEAYFENKDKIKSNYKKDHSLSNISELHPI